MKYLIITMLLISAHLHSIDETSGKGKLFLVPTAGYGNETSVTVGGLVYYAYRPLDRPFNTEPDAHYISSLVSFKKQWQVNYRSQFFLFEDRLYVSPEIDYEVWPSTYFGFGNNTKEEDGEDYTNNRFGIRLNLINRLRKSFYSGLSLEHDNYKLTKLDTEGQLISQNIPGSEKNSVNSIGLSLSYDTRDFALFPGKGSYHQIEVKQALDIFSGDYRFTHYRLDLRRYFSINSKNSFGFQSIIAHNDRQTPLQKLNDLGSDIRGFEAKRYLDNSLIVMRGEYRVFPWDSRLLSRLGGVFFMESGQVANHFSDFRFDEMKLSSGTGLRISLIPEEKMNLRIDFGFSKDLVDVTVTTYEIF